MKSFHEMNFFTLPLNESSADFFGKLSASRKYKQPEWKPSFDLRVAIRHHKMTIALAMPQRERK